MRYEWFDWQDDDGSMAMSHTGVALAAGGLIMGAASEPQLLFRDAMGSVERVVAVADATELHGLRLVGGLLWIADPGFKVYGGQVEVDIRQSERGGQVFAVELDGRRRLTLEQPDANWQPTGVAVDEDSGDVWVADGYGASLVHRFAADGRLVATLTGDEGAGRFNQPHDVLIDRRGRTPELLVADRVNARIQVYDLQGRFRRVVGDGILAGPTQMAVDRDRLVVTDLLAGRVTILDAAGRLVTHLFAQPSPQESWATLADEWPLARGSNGMLDRAPLEPGAFLAPHGVAGDDAGTIFVTEFQIGGRVAVLTPRPD
jgi:hypothetical protein